jgi:hypothetical protein
VQYREHDYNVDMPFLGLYVGVCWKYNVVYEDAAQMKPSSYYIIFLILGKKIMSK